METNEKRAQRFENLIDRYALGAAGVCLAIVLQLLTIQKPLALPLMVAFWCASLAMPIFIGIHLARSEVAGLRHFDGLVAAGIVAPLFLLALAICALGWYEAPPLGVVLAPITIFLPLGIQDRLRKVLSRMQETTESDL
jgi:hypothetical protein